MEQHFTQSNEPIGLMVTTGFMTAQDITRLGTCSRLYYDSVTLNLLTWSNISIKNRRLTKSSLPTTLVARSAVTELSIYTDFICFVPDYMCEFPRLEVVKLLGNKFSIFLDLPACLVNTPRNIDYQLQVHQKIKQLLKSLPSSVVSFSSTIDANLFQEINLPHHIKLLEDMDLVNYSSDNEITEIRKLYNPNTYYRTLGSNVFSKFPKLEVLVLFHSVIAHCTVFPDSLHTFISYQNNQCSFPWPEKLRKIVRTIILVTSSMSLINMLTTPFGSNIIFSKLENLSIITNNWSIEYKDLHAVVHNLLLQRELVFPNLKNLRILHTLVTLQNPIIETTTTNGLNIFVGPTPDDVNINNIQELKYLCSST